MKSKTKSYPGFSILFSIGSYKKAKVELEEHAIKFQFLYFTRFSFFPRSLFDHVHAF